MENDDDRYNINNADIYHGLEENPISTYSLTLNEISRILPKLEQNDICLDLGSGAGRSTRILAATGSQVYGVELNKNMLNRASESNDSDRVKYIHSDIKNLPIEKDSVRIALANAVIEEIQSEEELIEFINEVSRVLNKSEGHFILAITNPKSMNIEYNSYTHISLEDMYGKNSISAICEVRNNDESFVITDKIWSPEFLIKILISAGFNNIKFSHPIVKDPILFPQEHLVSPSIVLDCSFNISVG